MENLKAKRTVYIAQETEYRQISERIARQALADFHKEYCCSEDTVLLYRGEDIFPEDDYQDWGVIYKNKHTGHYTFGIKFVDVRVSPRIKIEWNYENTGKRKDWLYRCQINDNNKKIDITPENTKELSCELYDYIAPHFAPALFDA